MSDTTPQATQEETLHWKIDGKNVTFTCPGGEEITLPLARYAAPGGWFRTHRDLPIYEQGLQLLEYCASKKTLAAVDKLDLYVMMDLVVTWQGVGSPSVGE